MMKKLIATILALVLALSLSMTAFAATVDENSESKTVDTTISTTIDPTYTVTIPANLTVDFEATSTSFGEIALENAQVEPGKAVQVDLSASGTLKNATDAAKTIAYTVEDENGVFTSAIYQTAGEKTALSVNITKDAWDAAYAGAYSDTVTFAISYVDAD
jgi:hypothetical protein